ncbi:MAG TPA: MFS transporter [Gemmataceae bacterium]|jgi:ACS family hexuronate transporter-like MFS transporter|nr:MFS transporter [Gemmataceae bacterium]
MIGGRSWKWWVCGALLLATMLNYMDRQTLSLTATQLKTEINLDDGRYGQLERWFSYSFAAGGIFFGFIADRIGPRRLYPAVLIGWSIAGLASPLASWPEVAAALGDPDSPGLGEFRWLFICRTFLGFCEAGHWPCALLTARNILSDTERPLGNSILQSGASLGAVLTPLVIQAIRAAGAPWQAPFLVIGVIGLLWVPFWFWLIGLGDLRYRPPEVKVGPKEVVHPLNVLVQFAALVTIVVTISLAWQFQRAWLPKYLKEFHHYSESTANYFTSGYYLVADVGCLFFGGVVSVLTRFQMHVRYARLISFFGCAALVSLSAVVPTLSPGPLLFVALLAVGAGALGAHPQYYALAQELPARHMGMLSGVLSASSWVVVGYMQGEMGDYIKQTGSYDLPLVVTGLAPLAGLAAMAVWVVVAGGREKEKGAEE